MQSTRQSNLQFRYLAIASALGALRLVLSAAGAILPGVLGFPGASGVINVLWAGGFAALPALLTRRFGISAIANMIYGILALPLAVSGPPGFLPKILIGLTTGLVADLVLALPITRRHELGGAVTAGALAQTALGIEFAYLGLWLNLPGIEKYWDLQFSTVGITFTVIGGAISGFLGWLVYSRVRTSPLVARLQTRQTSQS